MNLAKLIIPSFAQMLEALAGQLDKSKEQLEGEGKSVETLMSARLAPDMFPLSAQVQFVCIQAEEARARLCDEQIETVDAPESFSQAKTLLSRTVGRLRAAAGEDRNVDQARPIKLSLRDGTSFDLDLFEYVRSWSIPQFYFHLITAYAIMRREGINLGKADYVPHMFRFVRAEGAGMGGR